MRNSNRQFFMTVVICCLGVLTSIATVSAEEIIGKKAATVNAVPDVVPTAISTVASKTEAPALMPCKQERYNHGFSKFKIKKRELELNWNAAIGMSTYSENDEAYELSGVGAMLEINPGLNVLSAPGLDIGFVVGFLFLTADGSFSVDYEGPPTSTRNWEIAAISTGSYMLCKYSYDIDFKFIKIGLENGVGLGYFINSVSADWVDASDDNSRGDNSQDEMGWAPVVKAGLKLALPVTDVSSLGINFGANLIPLQAGDYSNFITISAGLNYQVKY